MAESLLERQMRSWDMFPCHGVFLSLLVTSRALPGKIGRPTNRKKSQVSTGRFSRARNLYFARHYLPELTVDSLGVNSEGDNGGPGKGD